MAQAPVRLIFTSDPTGPRTSALMVQAEDRFGNPVPIEEFSDVRYDETGKVYTATFNAESL